MPTSSSTTAPRLRYFSSRMAAWRPALVERDLEDLHRVGAALDARRLALGENHQIAAVYELQLEQPGEQRPVQALGRVAGAGDIEDHRIDAAVQGDAAARRLEAR